MTRSLPPALTCLALIGGALFLFRTPLAAMIEIWSSIPMYSYAYMVPVISVGLLWAKRHQLARPPRPAWLTGSVMLLASLLAFAAAEAAAIQTVQQLSFVATLASLVLLAFGVDHLKVSWAALTYLLLMVPVWDLFTEPLHVPFQLMSAWLGVTLMQAAGVPAVREGTLIALPNVLLEVARACSGVNYLVAVVALGLPLAYLRLRATWRRVVLLSSSVVIAMLANGVRIALIGFLAHHELGSPLHGPFHVLHGLVVALVGYVAIFAGLRALDDGPREQPATTAGPWRIPHPHYAVATGLAIILWTAGVIGIAPVQARTPLTISLQQFPWQLGKWRASDEGAAGGNADPGAWTGADAHVQRRFQSSGRPAVTVDVWYFEMQRQRAEMISSRTSLLHQQASTRTIMLPDGEPLSANIVRWPDRNELSMFWYQVGGVNEHREYSTLLRSMWNRLSQGRSDGAAVMLRVAAPRTAEAQALAALDDIARKLAPALARHWAVPDRSQTQLAAGAR